MRKTLLLALMLLVPCISRADLVGEVHKLPCADDAREFCPKEKPNSKGYVDCMVKHNDKLTPECQDKVGKMQKKLQDIVDAAKRRREACSDDFFKLCQGVGFDDDSRNACLLKHKRQVSDACAKELKP